MTTHDDNVSGQPAFDDAMRRLHAQALDRTSARTQAQLHQRRLVALASGPSHRTHRFAWPLLAAGAAAVMALAIGVQWRSDVTAEAPKPAIADFGDNEGIDALATTADNEDIDALAMLDDPVLDENPDLYLWLASDDAAGFVTE